MFRVHGLDAGNVVLEVTRADHRALLVEPVLLLLGVRVFDHALLGPTDDSPTTVVADVVNDFLRTVEEVVATTILEVGLSVPLVERSLEEVCLGKPVRALTLDMNLASIVERHLHAKNHHNLSGTTIALVACTFPEDISIAIDAILVAIPPYARGVFD